jgi:outer membrane protein OmpA-like peptidoglycan-associated protein
MLCIIVSLRAEAQFDRCDSLEWNFGVNQFAIDGDNLLADLAEKGWDDTFFTSNQIEVTIYGATDCPGSLPYNTKLAGNRALYLRNYFEVSEFPALTIADSYAIPERNCVRPGQGYNRADRITHLKVCWNASGTTPAVITTTEQGVSTSQNKVDETAVETQTTQVAEGNEKTEVEGIQGETILNNTDSSAVDLTTVSIITAADSAAAVTPSTGDGLVPADSAAVNNETDADSAMFILPTKAKKVLTVEKTEDLNAGDEVIVEGLNFYPGSHRTLPEAKPILKKLLETMQTNPTLMVEIQGHVCCATKPNEDGLDDETGDFRLSWNRAQFVRDYLVQNGIDAARISYRGYAMTHPLVYPEVTIQDQIKNRRVEILITAE